jgi:hypothetical protein
LSIIIEPEDPLVPEEVEPLVEPDVLVVPELLVEPDVLVVLEPLVELDVPELLVEPDEVVVPAEANWTASADVVQPPLDFITTLALLLKVYGPNSFHLPPLTF